MLEEANAAESACQQKYAALSAQSSATIHQLSQEKADLSTELERVREENNVLAAENARVREEKSVLAAENAELKAEVASAASYILNKVTREPQATEAEASAEPGNETEPPNAPAAPRTGENISSIMYIKNYTNGKSCFCMFASRLTTSTTILVSSETEVTSWEAEKIEHLSERT
jgi:regulator of replication initiation timing